MVEKKSQTQYEKSYLETKERVKKFNNSEFKSIDFSAAVNCSVGNVSFIGAL